MVRAKGTARHGKYARTVATEANAYFRWRVADAAGDIGIPAPPVVYHATRPAYVESILREGLRTGGVAHAAQFASASALSSSPSQTPEDDAYVVSEIRRG